MIEDKTLRDLFKTESEEHLQHLDDALLGLERNPGDPALVEEAFRDAHSLKGAARMLGLSAIQAIAHRLEDGLNAARRGTRALDAPLIARMSSELVELRRRVAEAVGDGAAGRSRASAPESAPSPGADSGARPDAATPQAQPEGAQPAPAAPFRIDSVRVDPRKLDALMTQAGELTVTKTRVARRLADFDALVDSCEEWEREEAARQMRLRYGSYRESGEARDAPRPPNGQSLLERLASVKAQLSQLRSGYGEDSARLEAIAAELESGIRLIRLLPLSNVFRLFPRLVRDLAQEQEKEVELAIEGEDTHADKRILEEMKDPLMHMLRNAVHHGIESPGAREQAGKPRAGQVRIRASQTASSGLIEVSDDGRGLDEQAIRRAALKLGLASEETRAAMAPAQIHSLIFASGLSTVGFVTNVSGRGVGL
ncbi:MAG: Hpt domain-containing protein, partial [Betaproteobacteria bacterium]|nr:Hpt domain-containing protein [Betaproteobacteria bacterium]